ncbi:MAG: shikimate kinase [Clostridium sp.]|uniref:shikimate kinase n=1 Tax=Clostridium sp. TaxID=1506 RepID=UPI00304F336C
MGNKNIVLIGMPGCGKSVLARLLSKKTDINYIDLDKYIQGKTNSTIADLFKLGEDYFRNIESLICKEVSLFDNVIISTGGGVVKRKENIDNLKKNGIIVFIDRPLDKILKDINTSSRPLLNDGKEKLISLYEERYPLYNEYCDLRIVNDRSLEDTINCIIDGVKELALT